MNPVLEFRKVSLAAAPPLELGVSNVSFALYPGEFMLVELTTGRTLNPLADLAIGLLEPESGEVLFDGLSWKMNSAQQAAACRGRIGRVFDGAAWVNNLDVDENVTLSARYHGHLADEDALKAAQSLAERLGLNELPPGRPAVISRMDLKRAEWVRALLGQRSLVIFEHPLRDLPAAWSVPLMAELQRRRAEGLAVIWIQKRSSEVGVESLKPTLIVDLESGAVSRVKEHE